LLTWSTDPNHNPTFGSCMLRIPGTINSKNSREVRVTQQWDRKRPSIFPLLDPFTDYIMESEFSLKPKINYKIPSDMYTIKWIERLLQTPVEDGREVAVRFILSPYLMNIRKLSYEQAFEIITKWLDKCRDRRRLDFNSRNIVRYGLNYANKSGYHPLSLQNVKQ
jgi:hypothetical protein